MNDLFGIVIGNEGDHTDFTLFVFIRWKRLRHDVCRIVRSRDMKNFDNFLLDQFTNVEIVRVDMFDSIVSDMTFGECNT
jgi:hypothetical protein